MAAADQEGKGVAALTPVRLSRLDPMPRNVRVAAADLVLPGEPVGPVQTGMVAPEGDEQADVAQQAGLPGDQSPVEPIPFLVVAIGIIVATLGASHFVSHKKHGHALADEKEGHGIFCAAQPQLVDRAIVRGSFCPAVPRVILVAAICIIFAVLEIVFFCVGKEVGEGKPIVAGDKVDRGGGLPATFAVEVRRTHDALHHFSRGIVIAAQEAAGRITVFTIPFHPAPVAGEIADLVEPTCIPGLGDEFAMSQNRIVGNRFEEGRVGQRMALRITAEHGREVETEAVDVVFGRPVAEAIEDKIADHRMVAIQGVSAATEIQVGAVRCEKVIGFVVQSAERNDWPGGVSFRRVVEDDVENHLDPGRVKRLDQFLELVDLLTVPAAGGKTGLGSAER